MCFIFCIFIICLLFINEGICITTSTINILLFTPFEQSIEIERNYIQNELNSHFKDVDNEFKVLFNFNVDVKTGKDYYNALANNINNDETKYDIYMLDDRLAYENSEYLLMLEGISKDVYGELNEDAIVECKLKPTNKPRGLRCLPFIADFGLLFYKNDIISKNLPFDNITRLNDYITEVKNKKEIKHGYAGQFTESFLYNFLEWANSHNTYKEYGSIINKNLEKTFKTLNDFREKKLIDDDIIKKGNSEILDLFLNNNSNSVAVFHGWFSTLRILKDNIQLQQNITDVYSFSAFPPLESTGKPSLTYIPYKLAVSKYSKRINTSKKIVEFLCSSEFQERYVVENFHLSEVNNIRYIFIFDPPYNSNGSGDKCSQRMWFFDLSLNFMLLAFIKKFYLVVNQLRSQLALYDYKSNSLVIIYCMFLFEILIKALVTLLNPNEIRIAFINYRPKLSYYTCSFDFSGGMLFLIVFFQIFVRSIIMIVITYLYLFVRKTIPQYYPAKFIIAISYCIFLLICLFYIFVGYSFYMPVFYFVVYIFYIYILFRLFLSSKDIIVINNFEKVNNGYYMNANIEGDNVTNYSGSDLDDESDELLSIDSSSSSTSCFSEYISPIVSEKDIISTYISLPYLSPFAENNVYIPCCVSFIVDSKVLIIEPIIKNKVVALVNNTIRSENITLLNYDSQKEYKEDDVIFYTQKDFRYIFSLNNFVVIVNNDLNDNKIIQLNEKVEEEYEFSEMSNGIFNILNKDHNSNLSLANSNNTMIINQNSNNNIASQDNRKLINNNNLNNKSETIPTIVRFNIKANSIKYKKWYNVFINHAKTRISDKIDIPLNIHKEFYSNDANVLNRSNKRQFINKNKGLKNKDSELELIQSVNSFENESDGNYSPYNYHYDINMASDYDQFVKNYSPFNYSRYQPIQISMDEDNRGQRINYNGEREEIPMVNLINNKSTIEPSSQNLNNTSSSITISANNTSNIRDSNLSIDTHVHKYKNPIKNNENLNKESFKNTIKYSGQDSSISHVAYSNISAQVNINSLNYEGDINSPNSNNDISFNSYNDIMDPLIINRNDNNYYSNKSHNNLTHRKMVKNSSNSYLYKSDSNVELSEEKLNLLPNNKTT
ncbi:hypothetical protein BCR36DRAFT_375577 [Piromyces finnis]|uniref:Periplasmic binding protein-like II n=1 Tax=Piromyces finnis TaxID=1754191 RepID=A0A1Y1UN27_9FUNG|nr:hypothetical protein BCR36DRAFT_375577 [Piromyces finnis]|eukprot:ORX39463.1 hypothetical protein BCR36DRAFT_375577 [Piromyces finnis]